MLCLTTFIFLGFDCSSASGINDLAAPPEPLHPLASWLEVNVQGWYTYESQATKQKQWTCTGADNVVQRQ